MQGNARPFRLHGITQVLRLETGGQKTEKIYITVNYHEARCFEVFIRCDDPKLYEWVNTQTVLVTRMLRGGMDLKAIAREMQEIHSAGSSDHFAGGVRYIGRIARVGQALEGLAGLVDF